MADVIKNEEAQVMLLTVFMIVVGVITYTTVLNNMIISSNVPVTGLENSKQDIRDLRLLTEAEAVKAAFYSNDTNIVPENTNKTKVKEYFLKYMNSSIENIIKLYASKGVSAEIIINNVSLNKTAANATVRKYFVEAKNHTFKNGSLIIPMDENQSSEQNQSQLMKVYGFVFKIVDDTGTQPLNQTRIPVWTILQNSVNSSVPNFSSRILTNNNASNSSNGITQYRDYSGGPFIVDNDTSLEPPFNDTIKTWILQEAKRKNITVHELQQDFYYERTVQMVVPPKVAVYPNPPGDVMEKYYLDGEVPYTALGDTEIQNGNLTNYDILTIPHQTMDTSSKQNTVIKIAGWVVNGGVLHVQCAGVDTMDNAVEKWAKVKPWYGFIGINRSEMNAPKINLSTMTYMKFIDKSSTFNSAPFNNTLTFNNSPPVSLPGLADPGAPFDPLAQNSNKSGMIGNMSEASTTPAFSLRENGSQVNPDANILGVATYNNGTPVYIDAKINTNGVKDLQLIYIEAKYEDGLVSYLAGHNQSSRFGGERIIFDTFFAASMRTQLYSSITAKNINITIKYFDGNVRYSDTFLVNT